MPRWQGERKLSPARGSMTLWGRLPPWATLALVGGFGLILIIAPAVLQWDWDFGIIHEIGVAFLAACILGFTIDRWMKAELRTDAFKAALGRVLLPEFQAEVSRIIGYKLISSGTVCMWTYASSVMTWWR
jgi:hypothetical protein